MICVVSHDAGGAEVLASHIARNDLKVLCVLSGPAISVFEKKLGKLKIYALEDAIANCHEVLCGTSWQSDLEWRAIGLAKNLGKHSTAYLDHWTNYGERFIRSNIENLPDEIWVGDNFARVIASDVFQNTPIKLVPNSYFKEISFKFSAMDQLIDQRFRTGPVSILYVSEPISDHGLLAYGDQQYLGYTEHDALRYFLENSCSIFNSKGCKVLIRPHPADLENKYRWAECEYPAIVKIGGNKTLLEEIANVDIVVGCESMALVIGLLAGKRVISSIPPGGAKCRLPYPQIESLQELILNDK